MRAPFAGGIAAAFLSGLLVLPLAAGPPPAAGEDALSVLPRRSAPSDHPCALPDAAFEEFHESEGVRIRILRRPEGAPIVRATARIHALPLAAAALVARVEGWPEWAPRVRAARRLEGAPPAFRLLVDAPWPFSDREYAIAPSLEEDAGRLLVFWDGATERLPPSAKGIVRISRVRGGFSFEEEAGAGTIRVVYTHESDLGGRLPGWAEDGSNRKGPIGVLRGLRRALASSPFPPHRSILSARSERRSRAVRSRDASTITPRLRAATPPWSAARLHPDPDSWSNRAATVTPSAPRRESIDTISCGDDPATRNRRSNDASPVAKPGAPSTPSSAFLGTIEKEVPWRPRIPMLQQV